MPAPAASPRRSILKKSACSGGAARPLPLRRSTLNVGCGQQVLDGERLMPVYGAERSATTTTKRVKFCM